MSINKVFLAGRLTKDIELRKTATGISVVQYSVACDRPKRKDQEKADCDFINCVSYSYQADYLSQHAKKGDGIAIDGRVNTRSYEKDSKKVYVTEVLVDRLMLFKKSVAEVSQKEPVYEQNSSGKQLNLSGEEDRELALPSDVPDISSDDLPFY